MSNENRRFRILALDGGGVRGAYTAAVLSSLEAMTGKRIYEHFDLITGTSTGGIIAVGLGLGVPASKILSLYMEQGREIFPLPRRGLRGKVEATWRHFFGPKHSQDVLRGAIHGVIGDRQFGESKVRLVIPAFDAVRGKIQLFKTAHAEDYRQDYLLPAITVALGTSAAPTYYPAYADAGGACYLDGGVWANCPAMVGLIEALSVLSQPLGNIEMLSIGTTCAPFDVSRGRRKGGIARWNKGLIDLFMHAQGEATIGQAGKLLGEGFLRIDDLTRPERFALDKSDEVDDLKALGEQAARQHVAEICRRFFREPAECFEPFHRINARKAIPRLSSEFARLRQG